MALSFSLLQGNLTTATVPVFDKVTGSGNEWKFLGSVSTDIVGCELDEVVKNETGTKFDGYDQQALETMHNSSTLLGCKCNQTWSWNGKEYNGICTSDDWPR